MKISIVTPSYNHADFIEETIRSVLAQRGNFELDYCVIDGGSRDGTLEILQKFNDQLCWSSASDNGQIDAINKGLQRAIGDVIGWINSDDLLLAGALQRIASEFEDPTCMWLHGDCRIVDRTGREIRRTVSAFKRYHAKRYSMSRLLQRNFISQMTVFWRRELLEQVGYLSSDFPLTFDYEFWLRLAKFHSPRYVREQLAAFRWYDESKSGANYRQQFDENLRVAQLHGLKNPASLVWKRLQHSLFAAAYGTLSRLEHARLIR